MKQLISVSTFLFQHKCLKNLQKYKFRNNIQLKANLILTPRKQQTLENIWDQAFHFSLHFRHQKVLTNHTPEYPSAPLPRRASNWSEPWQPHTVPNLYQPIRDHVCTARKIHPPKVFYYIPLWKETRLLVYDQTFFYSKIDKDCFNDFLNRDMSSKIF